jgi:hypothetical protein
VVQERVESLFFVPNCNLSHTVQHTVFSAQPASASFLRCPAAVILAIEDDSCWHPCGLSGMLRVAIVLPLGGANICAGAWRPTLASAPRH